MEVTRLLDLIGAKKNSNNNMFHDCYVLLLYHKYIPFKYKNYLKHF